MRCPRCRRSNTDEALSCRQCGSSLEVALLEVMEGGVPRSSQSLRPRSYTLGRGGDCDISLPDPSVSRAHARLVYEDGRFVVEDLKSRHGVVVDSRKVERAELRSGAAIRLGIVTLRFSLLDREGSTAEGLVIPKERLPPAAPDAAAETLDQLRMGVVLLAADGSVVLANRSARSILDGDGLELGPSGLRARDASVARELRRLLHDAGPERPRGGAFTVPRASRGPLTVIVTPLGPEGRRLESPRAVTAVFISDPAGGTETGEESLRRLWSLTPAEARLVSELLGGKTLEEAAAELAVSLHTARSQLKAIFVKTNTHRQTDLVRLLLSGPGQLRED